MISSLSLRERWALSEPLNEVDIVGSRENVAVDAAVAVGNGITVRVRVGDDDGSHVAVRVFSAVTLVEPVAPRRR